MAGREKMRHRKMKDKTPDFSPMKQGQRHYALQQEKLLSNPTVLFLCGMTHVIHSYCNLVELAIEPSLLIKRSVFDCFFWFLCLEWPSGKSSFTQECQWALGEIKLSIPSENQSCILNRINTINYNIFPMRMGDE